MIDPLTDTFIEPKRVPFKHFSGKPCKQQYRGNVDRKPDEQPAA